MAKDAWKGTCTAQELSFHSQILYKSRNTITNPILSPTKKTNPGHIPADKEPKTEGAGNSSPVPPA